MKKLMLIFGVLLVFSMSLFAQQTLVQTSGCLNGNTNNGVTTLSCGDEIPFYDDNGDCGSTTCNHGKNKHIIHKIKSPAGTTIRITFPSGYRLGSSASLKIYDSNEAAGTPVCNFTGTNTSSRTFTSTGNICTIKYDSYNTRAAGWAATISVVGCPDPLPSIELPCGSGAITIGGNEISTSATAYTGDVFSERTYYSGLGTNFTLTFTDLPDDGTNDYVVVYNGPSAASARLMDTVFASATLPATVITTSNYITFRFRSNGSNNGSWSATLKPDLCFTQHDPVEIACGTSISVGGDYTAEYYATTYSCPNPNSRLVIDFSSFPNDESFDYVEVYDGDLATGTRRGRYFGDTTINAIYSTSNVMTVLFHSNETNHGSWGAKISALCPVDEDHTLGCDDVYPINSTYTDLQYTRQVFRASDPEAQILLDFAVVNGVGVLPHDGGNDYVAIYDGELPSARLIGTYFGYGRPGTVASTGNVMTVVFLSNSTAHGNWSAAVSVDCPRDIVMPGPGQQPVDYTTCNSHLYDDGGGAPAGSGNYSNGLNNEYVILRPGRPNQVLHLEGSFEFQWWDDYITIYDGEGIGDESKILWGGGRHGHGHPRRVKGVTGCDCSSGIDCVYPDPYGSANNHPSNGYGPDEGDFNFDHNECVTFNVDVVSKTGALTVSFKTNGSNNCAGFDFHVHCEDMPTDCSNTGAVIFKEDFGGNSVDDDPFLRVDPTDPLYQRIEDACDYTMRNNGLTSQGGYYVLRKNADDNYGYFNYIDDHTHPGNVQRGYLFEADAAAADPSDPDCFYKYQVTDILCDGITLNASFWVANINNEQTNSDYFPNITIQFAANEDGTGEFLAVHTDEVRPMRTYGCMSDANDWIKYEAELDVPPGVSDVWIRILNHTRYSQGNDFVIDDIEVRACMPPYSVTRINASEWELFSSANICAGAQVELRADTVNIAGAIPIENPVYRWERGMHDPVDDLNAPIVWVPIVFTSGEWHQTNSDGDYVAASTNRPDCKEITVFEPQSSTSPAYSRYYYRVIVAGTEENLYSSYCKSVSEPYEMIVTRIPEIEFGGTNAACEEGLINLSITNNSPQGGTWTIYSEEEWSETDQDYIENPDPPFNASIYQDGTGYHVRDAVHDFVTVQYTTKPEDGQCSNTKRIPIYPLPEIGITPWLTTVCQGTPVVLHPESNQESSFQWTGGPGCSGTDWAADNTCADWTVVPEVPSSTYNLTVTTIHTIYDEDGITEIPLSCISTASKTISVLPEPNVSVSGVPSNPVCALTEQTLVPSVTDAVGVVTYSWDGGTTWYGATDAGRILTFTPTQDTSCHLIVRDTREVGGNTFECEKVLDFDISVYPLPTFTYSVTQPLCHGNTNGSILVSATGGTPYEAGTSNQYYDFRIGTGSYGHASTGDMTQMLYNGRTQGTYNITVRDSHSCLHSEDIVVDEPDLLIVNEVLPHIESCYGQANGEITVSSQGGTTFTPPDELYHYLWSDGQTTATATGLAAGIYRVTVYDAHNCTAETSADITHTRPLPSYAMTSDLSKCSNNTETTLEVTLNDPNPAPVSTHSWSAEPIANSGLSTTPYPTTSSITVTPSAVGTYIYRDTITAVNGCVVIGEVSVTVNPEPTLSVTGEKTQTHCYSEFLSDFTTITFNYGGGATGVTLTWNDETPDATCLSYTVDDVNKTLTIVKGSATVAGVYRYTVATTGAISPCTNPTITGIITIHPALTLEVSASQHACVTGSIGRATAAPLGGKPFGTAPNTYYNYAWSNGETDATITGLAGLPAPGKPYSVTVTDDNSCSVTGTVNIIANPNPVVSINDVETLCPEIGTSSVGATITTSTTPNYIYTWTNAGSFAVTTTNPVTTTATSITSTVSVPDIEAAGCSNTYTLKLQVEDGNGCLSNIAEKEITVEDVTPPTLTTAGSWPDNITGQNNCYDDRNISGLLSDDDAAAVSATHTDAVTGDDCSWTVTRTYTIKDVCNNSTTATMSVSGSDQTAPELRRHSQRNAHGRRNGRRLLVDGNAYLYDQGCLQQRDNGNDERKRQRPDGTRVDDGRQLAGQHHGPEQLL